MHVAIIGGGPAGLAAALSLVAVPNVRVTVLERRTEQDATAGGGAVNLTPLALRYLDSLGVGEPLRAQCRKVDAIELVSHRTGALLGRLWDGADAVRAQRSLLGRCLIDTAREKDGIKLVFGAKVTDLDETEDGVKVTYLVNGAEATVEADVLVGADGLHSYVRSKLVDPTREKTYTGKCVANGYAPQSGDAAWRRPDGSPLIKDTTLVSRGGNTLLMSYYLSSADSIYIASVMPRAALGGETDSRAGWQLQGQDKDKLRAEIAESFAGGAIACLSEVVEKCTDFNLYPVYMLPPGGKWSTSRVLLIGDAAHAMPPQGESTGFAIEDGVLLAHVFSRHESRPVPQLLADYESLRRGDIDKAYNEALSRWNATGFDGAWWRTVAVDWVTWAIVGLMNWRTNHGRDVRKLPLPLEVEEHEALSS